MLKKILDKIIFEMRMQSMDARWRSSPFHSCWEMYPPSFYYRYSPKEQKQIKERDFAEIREILEKFKEENGLSTSESK